MTIAEQCKSYVDCDSVVDIWAYRLRHHILFAWLPRSEKLFLDWLQEGLPASSRRMQRSVRLKKNANDHKLSLVLCVQFCCNILCKCLLPSGPAAWCCLAAMSAMIYAPSKFMQRPVSAGFVLSTFTLIACRFHCALPLCRVLSMAACVGALHVLGWSGSATVLLVLTSWYTPTFPRLTRSQVVSLTERLQNSQTTACSASNTEIRGTAKRKRKFRRISSSSADAHASASQVACDDVEQMHLSDSSDDVEPMHVSDSSSFVTEEPSVHLSAPSSPYAQEAPSKHSCGFTTALLVDAAAQETARLDDNSVLMPVITRRVFANETGTTCYLGSLLQATFVCSSFRDLVKGHTKQKTCGSTCPWCCLQDSEKQWSGAEIEPVSFGQNWKEFFASGPENWRFGERQHDPSEAWMMLHSSDRPAYHSSGRTMAHEAHQLVGIAMNDVLWAHHCSAWQDQPGRVDSFVQLDLRVDQEVTQDIPVVDLIQRFEQTESVPLDHPPACRLCGLPTDTVVKRYQLQGVQSMLVLNISRQGVSQPVQTGGKASDFAFHMNFCHVLPSPYFDSGNQRLHLRSVVVHRGNAGHYNDGHYVAYIVTGQGSLWLFNDAKPPQYFADAWPTEVYTQSKLLVYSIEPPEDVQFQRVFMSPKTNSDNVGLRDGDKRNDGDVTPPAIGANHSNNTEPPQSQQTEKGSLTECMPMDQGQDRVRADAEKLLSIFAKHAHEEVAAQNACLRVLRSLPMFVTETGSPETLGSIADKLDAYMHRLQTNSVNSAAALQLRPYSGDCFPYPFAVLILATSIASSMPAAFHENNFLSILGSLLNKDAYLQMGRFKTKIVAGLFVSRMWEMENLNV